VVADSSCVLGRRYHAVTEYPALAKKYVFISVGRVEQELRYDHSDIITHVYYLKKRSPIISICYEA
jgi:hypothetical protein